MDLREDNMKMNFDYFQIQKWMLQTECSNVAEKVDEKMGSFSYLSCFLPELLSLNGPKKMHFLQYIVDLSKNANYVKAIYVYASESSHYTPSQNGMVYRGQSQRSWDIND